MNSLLQELVEAKPLAEMFVAAHCLGSWLPETMCLGQGAPFKQVANHSTRPTTNPHGKTNTTSCGAICPLQTREIHGSGKVNPRSEDRTFGLSVRDGGSSVSVYSGSQIWWDRALPLSEVDGNCPRPQHVNFRIVGQTE